MIEYDKLRATIVAGLKKYLKCPVIRSNQNAEPPPYPYVSYTIRTLLSAYNGTYGEYEDGTARKPFTQTWSISVLAADNTESVALAIKAREWLDRVGTTYLNDNDVIVQSIGNITNRDNVLTVEYEYKNGFDVVFWLFDTINSEVEEATETIESIELGEYEIEREDEEALNDLLENRLDGV